jgi:hypothetical protein
LQNCNYPIFDFNLNFGLQLERSKTFASIVDKLEPTGRVFNFRIGRLLDVRVPCFVTQTAKLKVENLTQTALILSPGAYRSPNFVNWIHFKSSLANFTSAPPFYQNSGANIKKTLESDHGHFKETLTEPEGYR